MLRPRLTRRGHLPKQFQRSIIQMPPLDHIKKGVGIPGLLSPAAFDIAWTQYQSMVLQKLNKFTAGTQWENKTTKHILVKTARDPATAHVFNYASMAHNNEFFFQSLNTKETDINTDLPDKTHKHLKLSFGSIETFKQEMLVTAKSMFGPGFVWLVKDFGNKYSILCTYLAGTPYPQAFQRRQAVDMSTGVSMNVGQEIRKSIWGDTGRPVNTVGMFGESSEDPLKAPGAARIYPILCINVSEHVYLPDYGFGPPSGAGGGKEEFLERWWKFINWKQVGINADGDRGGMLK